MRISAYNFPVEIALKCFSVGFVLKCIHMIFFFREIRECLKLDPDHKECFPFYKVSIVHFNSVNYSSKFNKPLNNDRKQDKQVLLQFPFHR